MFLCFEFSGFHRIGFSTQAAAEADRESKAFALQDHTKRSFPRPLIPVPIPPACSCTLAPTESHLQACAYAAASPHRPCMMRPRMRTASSSAHAHAAMPHASLASSHRLCMQPALSLPPTCCYIGITTSPSLRGEPREKEIFLSVLKPPLEPYF
jgi:hypothetical protein